MAQINQDADPVHLSDDLVPVATQAPIWFVTSGANEVLRIVGKLHNSDTELFEQFDVTRVLFERGTILKTKNNARFVGVLGRGNVGRSTYFQQ